MGNLDRNFDAADSALGAAPSKKVSRSKSILVAILAVSVLLRVGIAYRGGQFFWPDESRYTLSIDAVRAMGEGHYAAAAKQVFGHADHTFFSVVGLVPALGQAWGLPGWTAAAFFGLFSVGSIYLVGRLALLTSRDEEEALLATGIAAGSSCLLYYSRHYFPYDPALFFTLLGLYLGMKARGGWGRFGAGVWIALGFQTYNGYWVVSGTALVLVTLYQVTSPKAFALRSAAATAGFVAGLAAIFAAEELAGRGVISGIRAFAGTVTQGNFDEGWTFIGSYLWQTEGWLLILWLACIPAGWCLMAVGRRRHLLVWSIALIVIYGSLGVMSAVLGKFVIYGRIARCVMPFLALSAAGSLAALGKAGRFGRTALIGLVALVFLQVGINVSPIVTQYFPQQFREAAVRRITKIPVAERGKLRLVNAYFFYNASIPQSPTSYATLFSAHHPLQYRPYQFEGYRRDQREEFNSHDLTMRLVRRDVGSLELRVLPDPELEGYYGPLRFTVTLPQQKIILGQPLITTGESEKGDFVYLLCDRDWGAIYVGFDHWGASGGFVSPPFLADYSKPHVFEVSIGSLLPPAESEAYRKHPEWLRLRSRIIVVMDGRTLIDREVPTYPAGSWEATVGENTIGGSTAAPAFKGTLSSLEAVSPDALAARAH